MRRVYPGLVPGPPPKNYCLALTSLTFTMERGYELGSMTVVASFLDLFPQPGSTQDKLLVRLLLGGIVAVVVAILINKGLGKVLAKAAETVSHRTKNASKGDQLIQTKRTETVLSVGAAVVRTLIIGICLYVSWRLVNPTRAPVALIGASTFFIVLGAATIGPLLRDITSGILMIAERWYNIGDHITVDPFWELSGVVEQMNLRSTKLRTLSGETVWVHNQHIQAVRVTPRGVRTISIDTFVSDHARGRKRIERILSTLPTGPTMIASALVINEEEELGDGIWRLTAIGQTAPGREWLIEDFAVKAIKEADEKRKEPLIVHGPIVRYTDPLAEKRFAHSMREFS